MRDGGPDAWQVVSQLAFAARSREERRSAGAGVLEDLVAKHPDGEFVYRIERAARADPRFAEVLRNVWMSKGVPLLIRARLAAIGARDSVAEAAMNRTSWMDTSPTELPGGWDAPGTEWSPIGARSARLSADRQQRPLVDR